MIYVIEVFSPSKQVWRPTSNLRESHTDAVRVLEHLSAVYPGKRRRVTAYEPHVAAPTFTSTPVPSTPPRRHA